MKILASLIFISLIIPTKQVSAHTDNFWILTNPEAPFVVQDEKRNLSGYVVDLVKGILEQAQIKQDILAAPWERVEREARTKANVLVFALARTPEREDQYHWITPITANVFAIYAKTSSNLDLTQFNQLSRLNHIAVLQGDVRQKILQENGIQGVAPYMSWQTAFDALLDDKAQAMFFSDAGLAFFCQQSQKSCQDIERVLMYQQTQSYLVLSKPGTDPHLVDKFTVAAAQYKASKDFKSMSQLWVNKYKKEVPIPMHLENGVLNLWEK